MHIIRLPMVAVTAGLLILGACSTDQTTSPPADDLKRQVAALGLDPIGMEDHGDYVIVEGDIRIEKSALFQKREAPEQDGKSPRRPVFQYYTTALVSETSVAQIKVNLSSIEGASDWAQAVRNAIADYNAAGSRIHMSEGTPADITYSSISSFGDPNTIAQASWPSGGKPGATITIARNWDGLTAGQKELTMVHELGHTIGLRHDNAQQLEGDAGIGAHLVPGTNPQDANSVMQAFLNGRSWSGFSQYDLIALRWLYNPITITFSVPTVVGSGTTCRFEATPSGGTAPYTVEWNSVDSQASQFYPKSGTGTPFYTHNYGQSQSYYYAYVTVTDAAGLSRAGSVGGQVASYGGTFDSSHCNY
jgi:hypothetical protein